MTDEEARPRHLKEGDTVQHSRTRHACIGAVVAAVVLALSAIGCGGQPGAGLVHAEQVAASCPEDGAPVASLIASDESGSRRGSTAKSAQQAVIRSASERTAICGGHLRLVIFAGSVLAVPVYDGELHLQGATTNARLRKAPKVTDAVAEQINESLASASNKLPDGATDVVGQLKLFSEYRSQLLARGRYHLELTVLTDGIQTAQQSLDDPSLTVERAEELASSFAVPELPGSNIRLIGIGRQANGELLPTPYVEALRAFHAAICERTKAHCTVVTDAAGA